MTSLRMWHPLCYFSFLSLILNLQISNHLIKISYCVKWVLYSHLLWMKCISLDRSFTVCTLSMYVHVGVLVFTVMCCVLGCLSVSRVGLVWLCERGFLWLECVWERLPETPLIRAQYCTVWSADTKPAQIHLQELRPDGIVLKMTVYIYTIYGFCFYNG